MSSFESSSGSRLVQLARQQRRDEALSERCDMCGAAVAQAHHHLYSPDKRVVRCSCQACAFLFDGSAVQPWVRLERAATPVPFSARTRASWRALGVPVELSYTVIRPSGEVVALYPGPMGVVEASVRPELWSELVASDGAISDMEADVEALLVRDKPESLVAYRVTIDIAYSLVGTVRTRWAGLGGGAEVEAAVDGFFARLADGGDLTWCG